MTTNPMTAEEAIERLTEMQEEVAGWGGTAVPDLMAALTLAINRLSEPSGELVEAMRTGAAHLEAAAVQFELYEGQHRGKHTADGDAKAAVNSQWAARLRTEVTIARAAILSAEGGVK